MKIYYINNKIVQVNYDKDDFAWENNANNASILEIDEIAPENKTICIDLIRTCHKTDIDGNNKYSIQNGQLMELEGWEEYIDENAI